jgi:putative ABC transport system permease protein
MKYMLVFTAILAIFASVIAVGVVYNGARVALSERSRELASLRVLGFTEREVATILFSELFVQTALGILGGLVLGKLLVMALVSSFETDTYRMPAVVEPRTYAFATLVVGIASIASGLVVMREIKRLDLVGVLKTRE